MEEIEAITPIVEYRDSPRDPQNYLLIKVDIDGLRKKLTTNMPANGNIKFDSNEKSFKLTVELMNKKCTEVLKVFKYEIRKLPAEISTDPKKTFYQVKKNEVELHLCKVQPGSWTRWLSSVGLEQDDAEVS